MELQQFFSTFGSKAFYDMSKSGIIGIYGVQIWEALKARYKPTV